MRKAQLISITRASAKPQGPAPRYIPKVAHRPHQSRRANRYHIPGLFPPSR
jgi:hypothetical protein